MYFISFQINDHNIIFLIFRKSTNLPALMCTSRLMMAPTSLVARHLYTALCTSCRYMAGGNGNRANVPLDMSSRRDCTSCIGVPSAISHRMYGAGCPAAVQSIQAPVVLENSNFPGGSSRNDGPVKSDDVENTDGDKTVGKENRIWSSISD